MLDIKQIRQNPKEIERKLQSKDPSIKLDKIIALDTIIRDKKTEVEAIKAKRNALSDQVGERKRRGEDASSIIEEVHLLHEKMRLIDHELNDLEKQFIDLFAALPNIPEDDVKNSQNPADNVFLRGWGAKREFDFPFKNHLELNDKLGLFDFQRAASTSGSSWPAYRGLGARLEWALINYMLNYHLSDGFEFWMPPLAVRPEVMFGSGQLPKFEGQQYKVLDDDQTLFLIPTAEVVLNGFHIGEIIPEEKLPIKYVSYTPCFRREAGGAGEKERGLIRMHQFNKVELYAFCTPSQSWDVFEEFICRAERILEGLELHYRTMKLVTGDMSFAAAKTVDIEVYLPGQNRYYEVSSVSNCTDYQSRRSKIRFKGKSQKEKPSLVHSLNGSALATSRLLVAILENNQQQDGSVVVPKVLRPYLGGIEKLEG